MQLYDYILEIGVKNYKESVVMVDLLAMIDCACDIWYGVGTNPPKHVVSLTFFTHFSSSY